VVTGRLPYIPATRRQHFCLTGAVEVHSYGLPKNVKYLGHTAGRVYMNLKMLKDVWK
jgi:hypothetical protein